MLEAIIVASIDHGVTAAFGPGDPHRLVGPRRPTKRPWPRASGAITDVHGGAGEKAAEFFLQCAAPRLGTGPVP